MNICCGYSLEAPRRTTYVFVEKYHNFRSKTVPYLEGEGLGVGGGGRGGGCGNVSRGKNGVAVTNSRSAIQLSWRLI